jgi:hypothetical protein
MLLAFSIGFGAFMFAFALTAQDGLHQNALHGALAIVSMALLFLTRPVASPKIINRFGRAAGPGRGCHRGRGPGRSAAARGPGIAPGPAFGPPAAVPVSAGPPLLASRRRWRRRRRWPPYSPPGGTELEMTLRRRPGASVQCGHSARRLHDV